MDIVFSPFDVYRACNYCPENSPQQIDWISTLDYASEHLDLAKTTVRIPFVAWIPRDPQAVLPYRGAITADTDGGIRETYMTIVKPLKRLKGLGRFFASMSDPTAWSSEHSIRPLSYLKDLEDEAEKWVMGEHYDAVAAGKLKVSASRWQQDHANRIIEVLRENFQQSEQ